MKISKLNVSLCILLFLGFINCSTAQWLIDSSGLGSRYVLSIASSGNNIYAGTLAGGLYLSTNNGSSWVRTSLYNPNYVWALAINGNNVFAGTDYGLYLSTNNGLNWINANVPDGIHSFAVSGNNLFAGTSSSGVYLSTNNGLNWTQDTTGMGGRQVRSLAAIGSNIFAGTWDTYNPYGLYLSTNNGSSWVRSSLNNVNVLSLAYNGNYIFAGADNAVYLSTNNGLNWALTSLYNPNFVWSLAANGSTIIAGTYLNGIYVSNNNGANWTQRNEGIGNLDVPAVNVLNNYVYAGNETSVYRRPLTELTGIKTISEQVPASYSLSQNYPNPFNPVTQIKFDVPKASFVKIRIFDLLGREVSLLVSEHLNAGEYQASWDASRFASGVYIYRIETQDFTDTKKMILVK